MARLAFFGKYQVPPITDGRFTEHEWTALFLAASDDPVRPDPKELEGAADFTEEETRKMIASHKLTQDAVMLLRRYFER